MNYIINMISSIEPFNQIEPERLNKISLVENMKLRKFNRNQMIYLQGENCNSMDIVIEGAIDIHSMDQEGNMVTLARFTKDDIVGINLLFSSNNSYPFSVIAVEDTEILEITKDILLELSRDNPKFTESLLRIVSDKALSLANWITHISMKPLREKILDFLELERRKQSNDRIVLTATKKEIAERLGVQRTSLSRELQKMKEDGILKYDRDSITLLKR
ncbi:Crp/Fnr family transcriptional regulator [Gudongella sp. DL1XJH-153]|uniref:Crp/Fnr family transcriptional regulator n=1 Tax=Gudongella sp. DL1XJH-153 TaxID=3409804 RepID=UPI003BB50194